MSARAKAVNTLYRFGKITKDGVRQAVIDGIITVEEYKLITNEEY